MSFGSFDQTLDHLRRRWSQADRAILRHLFPLLAEGRPVSPGRLAEAARTDVATAERTLVAGRADRDGEGNAVALFGIGHPPTSNRIQVGSVCLFSCCALTAQMVPHLLSRTATIESVDPVGRRLVRLTSTPAGIQSAEPAGASATLVVTTEEGVREDIASAFCTHIHHFPDAASARAFASADPRRYVVSMEELHEAARRLTAALWN